MSRNRGDGNNSEKGRVASGGEAEDSEGMIKTEVSRQHRWWIVDNLKQFFAPHNLKWKINILKGESILLSYRAHLTLAQWTLEAKKREAFWLLALHLSWLRYLKR